MESKSSGMWEKLSTAALVIAALAIAGAVVLREFRGRGGSALATTALSTADWNQVLNVSTHVMGDSASSVPVLIEFTDFECSACRHFHRQVLREVLVRLQGQVNYRVVHFPLGQHPHAVAAATAFECASDLGSGHAFAELVFEKQDSLGMISWREFAARSRIENLRQFDACVANGPPDRAVAGRELALRVGARGTPTIAVDGEILVGVPSAESLRQRLLRTR